MTYFLFLLIIEQDSYIIRRKSKMVFTCSTDQKIVTGQDNDPQDLEWLADSWLKYSPL